MPFWNKTSTTLPNDQTYVNNTYKDANGNNQLTTISAANPTGFVPVSTTSTDPIVKNLSYAIQNDGKITYKIDFEAGGSKQFNSIQEIAGGVTNYSPATTAQIKNSMQTNLSAAVKSKEDSGTPVGSQTGANPAPAADPANPDASSPAAEGSVPVTEEGISKGIGNLADLGKSIEDGGVRAQYGNWKYPLKFPQTQDRIKFTMFRYVPKNVSAEQIASGGGFGDRPAQDAKDSMGSVTLPIQPQISDSNAVKWGSSEMNALEAMAAAASFATITEGTAGAAAAIEGAVELLKTENSALKTAAAAVLAGEAAGGNKDFLTRVTGAVVNPNLELLFGGPELRSFNFTFTLSAREPKESEEIRRIIRFFKQGMSVKKASTNLFLKTPNIFDIKYYQGGETNEHPWINQIKTCALTNFGVNYTPAGNYATYYDGAMTQYDISMTFSEIDPIYDSDYKDDGDTTIGY